jgi:hypothetical protein
MTPDQRFLAIGCYINSALYLTGCFVVSVFVHHGHAYQFALISAALCFLSYSFQIVRPQMETTGLKHTAAYCAGVLTGASTAAGAIAGVLVLLGG